MPLPSLLSVFGLGSKGSIGTLNPATGALVPNASGFLGGAGSLLTNPFTMAAGAGLLGAQLWIKSQGHRKANEWVRGYQDPWGNAAIKFMDDLQRRRQAGTLTHAEATAAQSEFETNVGDFWDQAGIFSARGGDHATVIRQAHSTLDPTIEGWRKTLQSYVDALAPNPTEGIDETKPPGMPADATLQAERRADQERKRAQSGGRRSTILTGPRGLTAEPVTRKRTLLTGYA